MKINFHIIEDALRDQFFFSRIVPNLSYNIRRLQILNNSDIKITTDTVYIVYVSLFYSLKMIPQNANFIVIGGEKEEILKNKNINIIGFSDQFACEDLLNNILTICYEYDFWYERLSNILNEQRSFSNFLVLAAEKLNTSFILFDEDLRIISQANSRNNAPFDNPIWREVSLTGRFSPKMRVFKKKNSSSLYIDNYSEPFRLEFLSTQENHTQTNIFNRGHLCGMLLGFSCHEPITDGHLAILGHLQKMLESVAESSQTSGFFFSNEDVILINLLKGENISDAQLFAFLEKKHWDVHQKTYRLLIFLPTFDSYSRNEFLSGLRRDISEVLINCASCIYDGSVVVLVSDASQNVSDDFKMRILAFCQPNFLSCGISSTLSSMDEIYHYYRSTRTLVEATGLSKPRVLTFSDDFFNFLLTKLSKDLNLDSIIHLQISRLYNYDKENDTELTSTLLSYLQCGQNLGKTSKKLFIHRNTLVYRLKKISELINNANILCEDCLPDDEFFYVYLSCKIVLQKDIMNK